MCLAASEYLQQQKDAYAVCVVGNAKVRRQIIEKLLGSGVLFATIIDPSVIFSKRISIGEETIIGAGTIATVDISIGKHVIINLDCTLGHDDVIENFVTIYPSVNLPGNVIVGECCELGIGTQVIQGKKFVKNTIVGAGAVVIRDINESGTYVGCPIRKVN